MIFIFIDKRKLEILQSVLQLEDALPSLGQYIHGKATTPIVMHPDSFATFVGKILVMASKLFSPGDTVSFFKLLHYVWEPLKVMAFY